MRIREMTDGPVEQRHHVLMPRPSVIIEPHQALPTGKEVHSRPEGGRWKLHSKKPSKPSFQSVRHVEASAPGRYRQRGHETMAVAILEAALDPVTLGGYAASRIPQQFNLAKRGLIRIVKRHVAPPCQMTEPYHEARGTESKSQYGDR
jgi:hypothetical protein